MNDEQADLAGSALMHIEDAYLAAVEPDFSDADYSLTEWIALEGFGDAVGRAARAFKSHAQHQIAAKLGVGSKAGIRIGDRFIREGQGGTWKVRDAAELREWIDRNNAWEMVNLAASGAVTVTRLKEYLVASGQSPEAVDTYMEREPIGSVITVLPIDKAPKFAAKLGDGERYTPKPRIEK